MAQNVENKLRVNMTFDGDWVRKKGYHYDESPVLILSDFVREKTNAELIVSNYNFMCLEIPKEQWDDFAQQLERFVRDCYMEEKFWNYVQVDGGREGWKPKIKTQEEKQQEKKYEEMVYNLDAWKKNRLSGVSDLKESEAGFRQMKEQCDDTCESDEGKMLRDKKELAEGKLTMLMRDHRALTDCPPLLAYVEHMKNLMLTMLEMGTTDCLWSKKLLVSMDYGYGFSTFLESISEMLLTCGLTRVDKKKILEYKVSKTKDGDYSDWEKVLGSLRSHANSLEIQNAYPRVVAVDLTEWQDEFEQPKIQDYLRRMAECSWNYLCVFRVGLFEETRVRELEQIFSNVMSVQTLIAYPPSIESMAEYLSRQVEKKGFSVLPRNWENWDVECDPKQFQEWNSRPALKLLEQWISEEKRKTYFSGYQSLNGMAERLIYKKAEINVRKKEYSKVITAEDMYELMGTTDQDPLEELDALIGMNPVKERIKSIVEQLEKIKNPANRPTLHMCFVGNPGTGKTTVARIIARIFEKKKLLSKGRYVEVHGRDLCAVHVGETSIRTKQYCRDAYGSVLFVDEAYSLYSEKGSNDFGREAVSVLIQQMENHRHDMCVILAGYKDEINALLDMNPGFKDRVRIIEFKNYEREELVQIFFKYLEADRISMGLQYDREVLQKAVEDFFLSEECLPERKRKEKDFGNARFVRNLYELVRGEAVCRKGLEAAVTLEIRKEDFENAVSQFLFVEEQKKVQIGFQ